MPRIVALCAAVALMCAGCLVEGDPLGGPHGGTGGYVPPGDDAGPGDTDAEPPVDSGRPVPDSGHPEPDAQAPDAGHPDAGDPDTGAPDTGPPAPTWTDIFDNYVAAGTKGNCGGCHAISTAADGYTFLKGAGQIDGTSSSMVTGSSIFSWFGGVMPFGGPRSYPAAVADMKAWVAAGAVQN